MTNLTAKKTGKYEGKELYPHKYPDGKYVASPTKYEADYVRVDTLEELEALVRSGYGVRMSNPEVPQPPSRIVSSKIHIEKENNKEPCTPKSVLPSVIEDVDLDPESTTKIRKEQSLLRSHLLNGSDHGICVICEHELPIQLLVAAHIKKRSKCSTEEKLDFDNVAALMCRLGCDELFEKGYITVSNGKVRKSKKRRTTHRVDTAIKEIEGNKVRNWSGSGKYYEWHEKEFNK